MKIGLDQQIDIFIAARGKSLGENASNAILLSLRRLKRIEELMREPSFLILVAASAEHDDFHKMVAGNAALLKQVEEEVK